MENDNRIDKLKTIVKEIRDANSRKNFIHEAGFMIGMMEAAISGEGTLRAEFVLQAFIRISESEACLGKTTAYQIGQLVSELNFEEASVDKSHVSQLNR